MAKIYQTGKEKVYRITKFLGLNESPDGDTKLKTGEASACSNWRVTRDGNLQVRPGSRNVCGFLDGYALTLGDTFQTYHPADFALTLWPVMEVTETGLIAVSGDKKTITAADIDDTTAFLRGMYYFRSQTQDARQIADVTRVTETGQYIFTWRRVSVSAPLHNAAVHGLWYGSVGGVDRLFVACCGRLWAAEEKSGAWTRQEIGPVTTTGPVHMFGFSGRLYIINGTEYKCYDGSTLYDVTGYRPLVTVGVQPEGGGTSLEQVNKLNGLRRCWLSPTEDDTVYQLPETGLASIDWVKLVADDTILTAGEDYTTDLEAGTITFSQPQTEGTNTIEVAWTYPVNFRDEITAMRFSELYNGTTDNRVFLYGDGSNTALYSGVDYDGNPSAEYFPDMNEIAIGDENTPITSLIRHYSRLIAFKTHSAYSIQYSSLTLADGSITAAFYTTPINRAIGNAAPGQVQLVTNDPITLHGMDIYQWKNNSSYTSNLSVDERQARRISDRINSSFSQFSAAECICYDNNYSQELYIVYGSSALVWNYAADAWYFYTNFPATCMIAIDREMYYGTADGYLRHFSNDYRNDNGQAIDAMWRSGSMSFNREWLKKYTLRVFVGTKPDKKSSVSMYVNSDRDTNIGQGDISVISGNVATFVDADFSDFGFNTSYVPHISRRKLKAKKYAYCQLVLSSSSAETTAKLTSIDITVRDTVYAR